MPSIIEKGMMKKWFGLLGLLVFTASIATAQVTYERIRGAAQEPQNWLTYSGSYAGWRYSTLDQISASNASALSLQWAFQVGDLGQFETTPLAVDGVLYGTGQNTRAFAIDARTGRAISRSQRNLPDKLQPCCGMVNRGFAILGNKLFLATLDAHVIALDTKTGNVLWDVTAADYHQAYTFTVAPLAVKNEVIVGVSGGEYGVRGFIDAYDADMAKRLLRAMGKPETLLTYVKDRPGHDRRYALDCKKIETEIGWKPAIALDEGLRQTIAWYEDNSEWLAGVRGGEYQSYYEKNYKNPNPFSNSIPHERRRTLQN